MAEYIVFEENKYFDMNEQRLYIDGKPIGKVLKGIPYKILKYLAINSPIPLTQEQIRDNCWKDDKGEGNVSYHIMKLRQALYDNRTTGTRQYKYIMELDGKYYCKFKITTANTSPKNINNINEISIELNSNVLTSKPIKTIIENINEYSNHFLNSIMYCKVKWGACTYDREPQNTNTCEGLISILLSSDVDKYDDLIESRVRYLIDTLDEYGLQSKSLNETTVVPTSMFLYLTKLIPNLVPKNIIEKIAKRLWEVKDEDGWGLYVEKMGENANIGCTYWALIGLLSTDIIDNDLIQNEIKSLFRYDSFSFGRTVNEFNPRIPCLYSTSMMYILFSLLSKSNREKVSKKYDHKKAIEYIVEHFDNLYCLVEDEGINGVEITGKNKIHTVNWKHMTIHYSLAAISIAIFNNELDVNQIYSISERIDKLFKDNCQNNDGKLYWCDPNNTFNMGDRGKAIFPTMHAVIGLSYIRKVLNNTLEKEDFDEK